MKKLLSVATVLFVVLSISAPMAYAQRTCGNGLMLERLGRENPEALKQIRQQHKQDVENALANTAAKGAKVTAQAAVPVVFHYILTQAEYNKVGMDTGIRRRVISQLANLNRDFNRKNPDSTLIPDAFKPFYNNAGIKFGIAKATNANTISGGIELKIITGTPPVYDVNTDCYNAKLAGTGLPPWDVTKYLNIWVVNMASGGGGFVLGITTYPEKVGLTYMSHLFTSDELGVVMNYGAVGVREFPGQYFINNIDLGRTLTHEVGHYFGLWHIWGDDNGACPSSGGFDDDIADTPPQADATYCNRPPTGTACPTYPLFDICTPSGSGIMFMNYMDYTDDRAMQMFTTMQCNVMKDKVQPGNESYSLTQHPELLKEVDTLEHFNTGIIVSPNPARSSIHISIDNREGLASIDIVNLLGQHTAQMPAILGNTEYYMDVSTMPRGLYFVQCRYQNGIETKKIVLE